MYWVALLNLVIPQFVDLKKFSMYAIISPRYNNGFIAFYNPYTFISFSWLLNVEFIKFFFSPVSIEIIILISSFTPLIKHWWLH